MTEDLSKANIILGIKEVPEEALIKDKTYIFFSHTHKGNKKNMPMLQSILDKVSVTLAISYFQFFSHHRGKFRARTCIVEHTLN